MSDGQVYLYILKSKLSRFKELLKHQFDYCFCELKQIVDYYRQPTEDLNKMLGSSFIFRKEKEMWWWFAAGVLVGAIIIFAIWTCCVVCGLYDEKEGTK